MPTSTLLLTKGSQTRPSSFPSLSHPSSLVSWTLGSDYVAFYVCVVPTLVGMLWITKTWVKSELDHKALPMLLNALNHNISWRPIPSRHTPWAGAGTEKHSYMEQLNAGAAQAKQIILHDNEKQQLSCFPKPGEFIPPCLRSLQPAWQHCTIVHAAMLADISLLLFFSYISRKNNTFPKHFECLLQFVFSSHFIISKIWGIALTSFSGGARHLENSKPNSGY